MPMLLTDLLLFSVLAAWVTGMVIAIAGVHRGRWRHTPRATPIGEIPIEGAGFGDQLRKGYRLVGRPVRVKRRLEVKPSLRLRHCRYKVSFHRPIAGTL